MINFNDPMQGVHTKFGCAPVQDAYFAEVDARLMKEQKEIFEASDKAASDYSKLKEYAKQLSKIYSPKRSVDAKIHCYSRVVDQSDVSSIFQAPTGEEFLNFVKNKLNRINYMEVDVTKELDELLKSYEEALKRLEEREKIAIANTTYTMKLYIDVHDQKLKMAQKIFDLKRKITPPEKCSCGCEDKHDE